MFIVYTLCVYIVSLICEMTGIGLYKIGCKRRARAPGGVDVYCIFVTDGVFEVFVVFVDVSSVEFFRPRLTSVGPFNSCSSYLLNPAA